MLQRESHGYGEHAFYSIGALATDGFVNDDGDLHFRAQVRPLSIDSSPLIPFARMCVQINIVSSSGLLASYKLPILSRTTHVYDVLLKLDDGEVAANKVS